MNETCDDCRHSPASHKAWGTGRCEARACTCEEYVRPCVLAACLLRPGHRGSCRPAPEVAP